MDMIDKTQIGGANANHSQREVPDKYSDDVGLNAGGMFATGSPDGKGTDRGFTAPRAAQGNFNPQNTHKVVCPESPPVEHVGPVAFPDEP